MFIPGIRWTAARQGRVLEWKRMPVQIGQKQDSSFDNPLGLLSDCHRRIEQFLAVLIKVADTTGESSLAPGEAAALQNALDYFHNSGPKHTADEEESLFPRLKTSADGQQALEQIAALEREHDDANRDHEKVEALGREWLRKRHLHSADLEEMKATLQRLAQMYARHIDVEDKELFPLASRTLSADALNDIGREMAERRGAIRKM
jgi:hemerythrin-like domain-containing protein